MSDCTQQLGVVVKAKGERAYVKVVQNTACSACKACFLANAKKEIVLPSVNECNAAVGDTVVFTLPTKQPKFTFIMLFIVPLACLFLGLLLAVLCKFNDLITFVCAISGLILGLAILLITDRLVYSRKYLVKITKVIHLDN